MDDADLDVNDGILTIFADVLQELANAERKFPGQHLPLGTGPDVRWLPQAASPRESAAMLADRLRAQTDRLSEHGGLTWAAVIAEEVGEAFAEVDLARCRRELLQVMTTALRAVRDIDDPHPVHYGAWRQVGVGNDGHPILERSGLVDDEPGVGTPAFGIPLGEVP